MSTVESQDGPTSTESVAVAVHIRPLIEQEIDQGCEDCLEVTPGVPQVANGPYQFTYDYVYGGSNGKNAAALYSESVQPLVEGLFSGYNATVFAYGQTGSGKTYTMGSSFISDGDEHGGIGVIPRAVAYIFERIRKLEDKTRFTVRVGFVEIHKEEVRDLLSTRPDQYHHVHVRELPDGGIVLAGAKEIEVENEDDMAAVLERGTCMRATGATGMNQRSSRSHAIFTITIEQRKIEQDSKSSRFCQNIEEEIESNDSSDEQLGSDDGVDDSYLCAKMHLVDLAGSERLKRTKSEGQRKEEGIKINQGLLALGNVINALSEGKAHVPYRDSKLTRMLQDSLGGNSRTLMIACVSPANINWEESLNTLRYANRARAIKNKPIVNRDPVAALIASLRQQLDRVNTENAELRRRLGISNSDEVEVKPVSDSLQIELDMTKNRLGRLAKEMHASKMLVDELKEDLKSQAEQGFLSNMQRDKILQILVSTVGEGEANRILSEMSNDNFLAESTEAKLLSRVQELEEMNRRLRQDRGYDVESPSNDEMQDDWLPDYEQYCADETEDIEGLVTDSEITEVNEKIALLQAELDAKEEAIAKVTKHASMQVALKKHLEDIQRERDSLAKERVALLAKIREIQASSVEEKSNLERHYKAKLRDLDLKVKQADRKEQKIKSLEATQQRANLKVKELEKEIQHIKSQKSSLQKQAERVGKDYHQWKKKRDREFMHLAKEKQDAAMRLMKMEAQNARQQAYLRRKIEEAAAAKKKLQDFIDKRGNVRNMSMERNSTFVSRIAQSSSQANNKDTLQSTNREHLQVQSTNSRPGRESWLENELEGCTSSFEICKLLEEEKLKRREVAKRLRNVEKKLAALQNPSWWSGVTSPLQSHDKDTLLVEKHELNESLKQHSRKIQEFQSSLVQSKTEEEEKGLGAADISRWSSIQSLKEARIALTATFKVASKYKAQSWELQMGVDELTDELEMLRLRLEIAETEKLQTTMQMMGNTEYPISPKLYLHSDPKQKSVDPEVSQVLHDLDSMAIGDDNQEKSEELVMSLSEISIDMNEVNSCSQSIEIHVQGMEQTPEETAVLAHINNNRQKAGLPPCYVLTESMIQEELEGFPLDTGDAWKPGNKSRAEMVADYISLNNDEMKSISGMEKKSNPTSYQSPMQSLKTFCRRGSNSPASPDPTNSVSDPNIARSLNSVFETSINSTDATALIRSATELQSKITANQDRELSDSSSKEPESSSLITEESSDGQEKQPSKKSSTLGRSSSLRRQNSLPVKKVWIPN